MPTNVIVSKDGAVARLTLSSEDGLHVLSRATMAELHGHLDALALDADLRAVVLTAEGTRAFSAGADLRELAELDHESARAYALSGQAVTQALSRIPVPTVAALNGPAYGGGIELALACDFRLAAPGARIHYQAARLGLLPGWGGTQRLPDLVGPARAKAMMVLCQAVSPQEALSWGLVDAVSPENGVEPALTAWLSGLEGLDVPAMIQIKRALDYARPHDFTGEQAAFAACFANGRAAALVRAWLDRPNKHHSPS
ncbi:MAG: enoyl-CoA hydratase/isomerase family protein [Candidatus Sericytochromatia bacterium]